MRVKICGLTRAEDVEAAVGFGASAVGFVNVPGASRYLDTVAILKLAGQVPPFVTPVVVVDLTDPIDTMRQDALGFLASRGLRCVQFHGHEPPWELQRLKDAFGLSAIKAIFLHHEADLQAVTDYAPVADALLLDGGRGSGQRCDWRLAAKAVGMVAKPIILAGGLNAENVREAIRTTGVWGVDVSGGVEMASGIKNPTKMRNFIRAAWDWPLTAGDTG